MATYLAYGCGKRNHDFILTTEDYQHVFEANLVKGRIFGASDFEFVDVNSKKKAIHKVGKTLTKRTGTGVGNSSIGIVRSSSFKFDKEDVFNQLAKKGYILKLTKTHLVNSELSLFKGGDTVATLTINVKGPRQANVSGIGGTQRNTVIKTESTDYEAIFLAAFLLSRVEMSQRLK